MTSLAKIVQDGLFEAEISLAEIASERTPRLFPKTSHDIAKDALRPFRKAMATLKEALSENWHEMSDAPQDGSTILVLASGRVRQVFFCPPWNVWLPDDTDLSTIDFDADEIFGIGADLPTMWRHVPLPPGVAPRKLPGDILVTSEKPHLPSLVLEYFRIRSTGAASTEAGIKRMSHLETSMVHTAQKQAVAEGHQVVFEKDWEGIVGRWVEIRVPGNEPQLKGPFEVPLLRTTLIDLMTNRRDALVTVIVLDREGPMLHDGGNYLIQMDPGQADLVKSHRAERSQYWGGK